MVSTRSKTQAKEQDLIAKSRRHFVYFCYYVLRLTLAEVHLEWIRHIKYSKRAQIIAPRYHGKTTLLAVGYTVWRLGRNPNLKIKIIAQNDDKAGDILRAIIDLIDHEPRLRKVFPNLKPTERGIWTAHKILVKRSKVGQRDVSIEALGVTSSGTGSRADLLVFDDPCDYRNSIQYPRLRRRLIELFDSVWMNLLSKEGEIVYIGTVWHSEDLTYTLRGRESFETLEQAVSDDFESLWPMQWPQAALEERASEIGMREFDRQFRNKPISSDEQLIGQDSIEKCYVPEKMAREIKPEWPCFAGVDLALGKGAGAAYTVIFVVATDSHTRRWKKHIRRGRWSSPETAAQIMDVNDLYHPGLFLVENNAYQASLIEWISDKYPNADLNITGYFTGGQKIDLLIGVPSLVTKFDQGRWVIPHEPENHGETCQCETCIWIREMLGFPVFKPDDTVMASWLADRAAGLGLVNTEARGMGIIDPVEDEAIEIEKESVRPIPAAAEGEGWNFLIRTIGSINE